MKRRGGEPGEGMCVSVSGCMPSCVCIHMNRDWVAQTLLLGDRGDTAGYHGDTRGFHSDARPNVSSRCPHLKLNDREGWREGEREIERGRERNGEREWIWNMFMWRDPSRGSGSREERWRIPFPILLFSSPHLSSSSLPSSTCL